jgi:hypothetical protein
VKPRAAGVGSRFFAGSVARTPKVWGPYESGVDGLWLAPGPEQGANGSESNRHSKLEPGWLEVKVKVGRSSPVEPEGPEVIVVCGGAESSTYLRAVEQEDLLPAASVAVARSWAVAFSFTRTAIPGPANLLAGPRARAAPVQPEVA